MINQKTAIYRILDANLDRAREGLRIVEEWCRFGLNDGESASVCKDMRQELGGWHSDDLRTSRDTPNDPGTQLTHPQEEERESLEALLQANFCRVQEALRVLEEYGKLYNGEFATGMKQLRYQVYGLESKLIGKSWQELLNRVSLYLVTMPVDNFFGVIELALKGGLKIVQYRHKNQDDLVKLKEAYKLRQLCHQYGALFIVNDRPDIALAVNADGVHLGQTDMPVGLARQMLGSNKIIGKSTTNPQEMAKALAEGVDYIGVGPVYETPTKAGKKAAGLEYVRYAQANATVPWFAIGGIDETNVGDVVKAGASRVAVVRAIMQGDNPTSMTQNLLSQL
ncbi:thiamine phosphate synthase [Cyanobacterium stanieri LEGE 03274]|uniref:Thiamine-phosphate synthase n=1 Tax=Cyanobacterium stanieri LEGE 03274 TaxID=1828756 RepID=A0ABR9V279_9CHRO|nr:thiamine phosphate synthase [Cyanobacterium stanieri]MBE9221999.1 thiamine phosphate synthase [Cyanobacterium stanieri LEGE 03274]